MRKNTIAKLTALILALVLCFSLAACGGESGNNPEATPTEIPKATPVPKLDPQPEINDPGTPITYHVSNVFTDNMVVQRDKYVTVWGWAEQTSGYIYGEFMGEKRYAEIQSDGYWKLLFSPHEANTYATDMKIYPLNGEQTVISNILIGDVWLVSGQSNAELTMSSTTAIFTKEEQAALRDKIAADTNIRVINQSRDTVTAKKTYCETPQKELVRSTIKWAVAKEKSAWTKNSAIGFYFAMAFREACPEVPVGIIMMAAGGCALSELMPEELSSELKLGVGVCYYNAMIHPFIGLPFAGMFFYQGETNANGGGYKTYADNLKSFVETLRDLWDYDFPFYNVQLSCHGPDCSWTEVPELRNAQFQAEKIIPSYYLIVSMDKGFRTSEGADWAHPKTKQPIGQRLCDAVLATYLDLRDPNLVMSPEPIKADWGKTDVTLTFNHTAEGLGLMPETGDKLLGFKYYNGTEYVEADATVISQNQVKLTVSEGCTSVRYGMDNYAYPENANLQNSTGYPAPAFEINK